MTRPLPLQGTVYEKTNAEMEMKKINREEFWEQAKVSRVDGWLWCHDTTSQAGGDPWFYS